MKKVSFFLLLVLMSFVSTAFASEISLTTLSDDELILLHNKIEAEISAREIDTTSQIFEGVYVVGKDIKAGRYLLTVVETSYSLNAVTFETEETYSAYFKTKRFTSGEENAALEANAFSNSYAKKYDTINLNLHDGMVLLLRSGTAKLTISDTSWAP